MVFLDGHSVSSPRAPHQVVIEKEEHEGELMREVESLRKLLETQKGLQHTQERLERWVVDPEPPADSPSKKGRVETQLNALEKKRQEAAGGNGSIAALQRYCCVINNGRSRNHQFNTQLVIFFKKKRLVNILSLAIMQSLIDDGGPPTNDSKERSVSGSFCSSGENPLWRHGGTTLVAASGGGKDRSDYRLGGLRASSGAMAGPAPPATEREVALKQQLETKVQGTEERISQRRNGTRKVSLQSQLQSQHRGAQSKEEGIRRIVEECDRKLLELSSQITMVEESHRHDVEQIRSDIQGLERQERGEEGWPGAAVGGGNGGKGWWQ
eukprot:Skav201864  [mRNA]  locus=scaffold3490:205574:212531:- [translate_table: standard]